MLEYLKLAQSLDGYGNNVAYPITEKSAGIDSLLALGPKGVSIFQKKKNSDELYLKQMFAFDDITRGHWLNEVFKIHLRKDMEPCSFKFLATKSNNKKISKTMECYCRFITYCHSVKNSQQPAKHQRSLVKWYIHKFRISFSLYIVLLWQWYHVGNELICYPTFTQTVWIDSYRRY